MIQTGSSAHRLMVWLAVATGIFVASSVLYEYVFTNYEQGELHYRRGNLRLEDGHYREALTEFEDQLRLHPQDARRPSRQGPGADGADAERRGAGRHRPRHRAQAGLRRGLRQSRHSPRPHGPGRTGSWRLPQGPGAGRRPRRRPRLDHEVLPQAGPRRRPPSATVPSTSSGNCGSPRRNGCCGYRNWTGSSAPTSSTENPERAGPGARRDRPGQKISRRSWVRTQMQ